MKLTWRFLLGGSVLIISSFRPAFAAIPDLWFTCHESGVMGTVTLQTNELRGQSVVEPDAYLAGKACEATSEGEQLVFECHDDDEIQYATLRLPEIGASLGSGEKLVATLTFEYDPEKHFLNCTKK